MKSPHKRKPRSLGKRTTLNAEEIRQLMGYVRTVARDYRLDGDSVVWGRHVRISEFLNRLYKQETSRG